MFFEKYCEGTAESFCLHLRFSCYTLLMIALNIEDRKFMTTLLFLRDTFDHFELVEGEFVTRFSTTFDGTLADPEAGGGYITWAEARNIAFQVIPGKQLPRAFRLTFRLSDQNMEKTLSSLGKTAEETGITSLLFNLRYEHNTLMLITGCAYRSFVPDKTTEHEWDALMIRFLTKNEIPFIRN